MPEEEEQRNDDEVWDELVDVTRSFCRVLPAVVEAATEKVTGVVRSYGGVVSDVGRIVVNVGKAHGVEATLDYSHEFIVLENTGPETELAVQAAIDTVGADGVNAACEPAACSEDFARMLREKPGCYVLIGNGTDGHNGRPLHNPGYDFNDEVLAIGAAYWVRLTENILAG